MKSLQTLQRLSNLGKILSKIVFVFCMVGAGLSIAGIVCLALDIGAFKADYISAGSIIKNNAGVSIGTLYATMVMSVILCSGEAVLAKFAEHYFRGEIQDGTPFNFERAKELQLLGILTICIPIGTNLVAAVVYEVISYIYGNVASLDLGNIGSISLGIMFIIMSLVFRYGAECKNDISK